MNHKEVGEARDGCPKVGLEAFCPFLFQAEAVPALRIDREHGAADRVEARGQHEHVDGMLAVVGPNAPWRKGFDRLLTEIHEGDVWSVEGFEVAVIEDHALGAMK